MSPSKRGSVLLVLTMFVSLIGAGLAHVTLRLGVVKRCYQIGELTHERQQLEEEQRKLLVEQSLLRDPARIEKIATEQLHMERPDASRLRVVRPGVSTLASR